MADQYMRLLHAVFTMVYAALVYVAIDLHGSVGHANSAKLKGT
jgi:hypothetical protein